LPEQTDLLSTLPYFSELTPAELEQVRNRVRVHTYPAGAVVFLEGEPCPGIYWVASGRVRIFKTSPEGREQVLLMAGPGDGFNEVPVFDGGPNPATAQAIEKATLLHLPRDEFHSLVAQYPALALGVLRVFAARLRHLTMLVEDLSFRRVTSRLAKALLDGTKGDERRLTQQQMASLVGTSREVVNRSLRELERRGAIRLARNRVIILKPELLQELL